MNINEIFEKYTSNVLKNIDKDNFKKILDFLEKHFINSKESYFKIAGDSKFLYSITISDTKKEFF